MEHRVMKRKWPSPAERLKKNVTVDVATGCWTWKRKPNSAGYGTIMIDYKWWLAHRLSFTVFVGPIPDGYEVLHKCDTPLCINPDHLFTGTQLDNLEDARRKGRLAGRCDSTGRFTKTLS